MIVITEHAKQRFLERVSNGNLNEMLSNACVVGRGKAFELRRLGRVLFVIKNNKLVTVMHETLEALEKRYQKLDNVIEKAAKAADLAREGIEKDYDAFVKANQRVRHLTRLRDRLERRLAERGSKLIPLTYFVVADRAAHDAWIEARYMCLAWTPCWDGWTYQGLGGTVLLETENENEAKEELKEYLKCPSDTDRSHYCYTHNPHPSR